MMQHEELVEALKSTQLCALPQSASQMIELSKNPENGPQEFAKPISADLGLSTQVLRFVNSSFFGFQHKITSIPLALTLVSVRTIRNFVLWNGLYAVLPNPQCGPFSLKMLFQDSLRRAVFARIVAERYTKLDCDEVFTCALMQDMAIPILAAKWSNEYADMIEQSNMQYIRLSTLERQVMGWDHSDAGAILAVHWNLGELIGSVISQHTNDIFTNNAPCPPTITGITALSALLPKVPDRQWVEVFPFVDAFRRMFGPKLAEITAILSKTDTDSKELTGLINLGNVPKTLCEYWRETLNSFSLTGKQEIMATEEQLEEHFAQAVMSAG